MIAAAALGVVATVTATALAVMQPRANRTWVQPHAVMTRADVTGDSVRLDSVRTFTYTGEDRFTTGYDNRTYDLSKLETVWFIVTPFSKQWRGPAHTFVSFGFSDS